MSAWPARRTLLGFTPGSRLIVGLALVLACSRNPATGRMQPFVMSSEEEVALGQTLDGKLREAVGVYTETPTLTAVVERVGAVMSEVSERPALPWTFRVLDDPDVNAFALPGGFVYVTRGLLAHLNAEDELAAVLGHEAGHVNARHTAIALRRRSAAERRLAWLRIVDPRQRHVALFAAQTTGLVLLKHSRADEYEADDLSIRYVERGGYDRAAIPEVFSILADLGRGSSRRPTWLSTHPDPEDRLARIAAVVGADGRDVVDADYLRALEGTVFGHDPRDGYVLGSRYYQPRTGFQIDLPPGWTAGGERRKLVAMHAEEPALIVLEDSGSPSLGAAMDAFFAGSGLVRGEAVAGRVGGFPAVTASFSTREDDGSLAGIVTFIEYRERVLSLVAASRRERWSQHAAAVAGALASFGEIEPARAEVEPMRIRIEVLTAETSLSETVQAHPSAVSLAHLATLNHVAADERLPAGRPIKRVLGFNPRSPAE